MAIEEKELLMKIAKGDENAFSLLFNKYQQKIYALAYHLTESTHHAEEIVQDVFLKIWLKQTQLVQINNFESYLFIIARNHIYSSLRVLSREKTFNNELDLRIADHENSLDTLIDYKELTSLIHDAANSLPEQQYEVYRLSKEEGKTREQIAGVLKISPETVKVHLSRAMRTIRAHVIARMPFHLIGIIFWGW
jgi:RNA polymerase sigma-70 factor (family 1)